MSDGITAMLAARAAIVAAVKVAGRTMDVRDLLGAMIAIAVTTEGRPREADDGLAYRLMIEVVMLVGARRAREMVDQAEKAGAGSKFA